MALGTFTLKGTYQGLNGAPATGSVRIDGIPQQIADPAGNKVNVGPKRLDLDLLGSFTINLPTDSTSGNSTDLGYSVTVTLKGESAVDPVQFYAPAAGTTLDIADVTGQAIGTVEATMPESVVAGVLSAESAAATFVTAVKAGGPGNADITLYLNGTKLFTVRPGSPPTFV